MRPMLDATQPVVISEDEFKLVMRLYERVTHEKTEFLHHVRFFSLHANRLKLMSSFRALSKAFHFPHFPTIKRHSPALAG